MTLKESIDSEQNKSILKVLKSGVLEKLIQLEAIDNWLNVMFGVELDINVLPIKPRGGRFYGKGGYVEYQ